MKVALELIQPSPNPVRTTWDEDKMNELAQSIREQGVIVPVKVRPTAEWIANCPRQQDTRWPMFCAEFYQHALEKYGRDGVENAPGSCPWCQIAEGDDVDEDVLEDYGIPADWKPYELVYGHRRVEAARRAGLDEIEATIEGVDDDDAQWQALTENMVREDMTDLDKGRAMQVMQDAGYSNEEIAGRLGLKNASTVRLYLSMVNAPEPVVEVLEKMRAHLTQHHFNSSGALRNEPELRAAVLEKAAHEGLTYRQVAPIAQSVAAAPSPEAKRKLIDWEYSPTIHDPDNIRERAKEYGAHDALYHDDTPTKQAQWEQTPEIKAVVNGVLEAAKMWTRLIKQTRSMAEIGKMAPESRQFIAHRARTLAKTLTDWANELEARSGD